MKFKYWIKENASKQWKESFFLFLKRTWFCISLIFFSPHLLNDHWRISVFLNVLMKKIVQFVTRNQQKKKFKNFEKWVDFMKSTFNYFIIAFIKALIFLYCLYYWMQIINSGREELLDCVQRLSKRVEEAEVLSIICFCFPLFTV